MRCSKPGLVIDDGWSVTCESRRAKSDVCISAPIAPYFFDGMHAAAVGHGLHNVVLVMVRDEKGKTCDA